MTKYTDAYSEGYHMGTFHATQKTKQEIISKLRQWISCLEEL